MEPTAGATHMPGPTAALVLALLAGTGCASRLAPVPLDPATREPVRSDSRERVEEITFFAPGVDSVPAYLRRPAETRGASLGGVVQLSPAALFGSLAEIRGSALRMPDILRGAARFLAAEPEVDPDRIALVGVSFGVPFAAAAGRDTIFRGVALHYGGGDLERILRTNLPLENGFLRVVAARFLAWYFRALEPARHVDDIGPTPLLLVNGSGDTRIPERSALLLAERAAGPVRHVWIPHDHLMPGDTAVMRELADSTLSHFEFLRAEDPGRPPGSSRRWPVPVP